MSTHHLRRNYLNRIDALKTATLFLSLAAPALFAVPFASAQTSTEAARLVNGTVDETRMVTLTGNTRLEANAQNDRGLVAGDLLMEHMLLQLRRPADRELALTTLIDEQQKKGSPNFHKWLTAEEVGEKYGPNPADIKTVTNWLEAKGLQVNRVSKSGLTIDFTGTASQVKAAFQTEIHNLNVRGVQHLSNMSDPKVPAALGPIVVGVASLNDFRPRPMNKGIAAMRIDANKATVPGKKPGAVAEAAKPELTTDFGYQLVVPDDLHTIYNFTPLLAGVTKGVNGRYQKIVVIEDTDVYSANDFNVFRQTFGLTKFAYGTFSQVHPSCQDPGVLVGNDAEATLDAEWASAAAPNAAIILASCKDTETTFGGLIAIQNLIDEIHPPTVMSISYGECEAGLGSAGNFTYRQAYEQAASEGTSVFVSSGDEGAASCDADQYTAVGGITVSGFASTPYNVAVGGTDFGDSYAGTVSQYWNPSNTATYGSAKSYIPEIPWNDSCASTLITNALGYGVPYGAQGSCNSPEGEYYFLTTASGSGGPSNCALGDTSPLAGTPPVSGTCAGYPKPSYQSGIYGMPTDGVRDIPDVSLFAANGVWGHYYVFCYTDPAPGAGGTPCTGNPENWSGAGGTSFASPIMAGIQSLVDQATGETQGNPNYVLYQLAYKQFGTKGDNACNATLGNGVASTCVFQDVTEGDIDVNCLGPFNCYTPSGENGVLSTSDSSYQKAYSSRLGWDFATGIGTINVNNLVHSWNSAF